MICRVCLNKAECPLNIFDANGEQLNISEILELHFWFKALPNDSISTVICRLCWFKVDEFHKFYVSTKQAHQKLQDKVDTGPVTTLSYDKVENRVTHHDLDSDIKEELSDSSNWYGSEQMTLSNPLYEPEVVLKAENEKRIYRELESTSDDTFVESRQQDVLSSKTEKNIHDKRPRKVKNKKSSNVQSKIKRQVASPLDDEVIKKYIPMGCDLCTFVGEHFSDMTNHFKANHQGIRAYVMCCGRKLNKRFLLVQHAYKHKDPEFFKCIECKKVFSDGYILRSHMLANHAPEEQLKYQCDKCPKRFPRLHLLKLHKPSHIPVNERSFVCGKCPQPKAFASDHLLQIHVNMQHIKATNVCHVCAKEIRDNQAFEKHVRLHFEDSGPRVKCPRPDCDRWLKDEDNLKQHMRRHNDEGKTFTCNECGKSCKNRRSLKSHFNYAHSTEVFSCDECNKTFKRAITLKEHMAQHTGESLYRCPFCTRTFNSNANMHSHKKKMHPVEWDIWRKTKRGSSQNIISSNPTVDVKVKARKLIN